jgi:hypothetical protein
MFLGRQTRITLQIKMSLMMFLVWVSHERRFNGNIALTLKAS